MNPAAPLDFVVAHGGAFAAGATVVLGVGVVGMAASRAPAERRRLGLWTVFATAAFLAVAAVPLPRWRPAAAAPAPVAAAPNGASATAEVEAPAADRLAQLDALLPPAAPPRAAAPAPTEAPAAPLDLARLAAAAWLVFTILLAAFRLAGLLRLARLVRRCRPGPAELARAAGLPPRARLLVAPGPARPFCAGVRRPVVVVPPELLAPERRREALAVLRHEGAHLRAHDPFVQLLLAALAVPLGAHPLFWWIARDVRFQGELLADEVAAAADRAGYAEALLDLAGRSTHPIAVPGAVPVFSRPSEFFRRIQMLLQREGRPAPAASRLRRSMQAVVAAALVAGAGAVFGVPARAQTQEPEAVVALRKQNEQLRAECDKLRNELKAVQGAQSKDAAPPATPGKVELLPDGRIQAPPGMSHAEVAKQLKAQLDAQHPPTPEAPADRAASLTTDGVADLASRCLDLRGEVELADTEAIVAKQQAETGRAPMLEAKRAEVRRDTVQKKLAVVRKLVAGEIEATQLEIECLMKQMADSEPREKLRLEALVRRASMRIEALKAVL